MVKEKKRGFVMTGGGAKGLYEAGVIHAFHITGMEFEIITGSSIGAMNSIFFAEYLYQKKLPEAVQKDPEKAVEALDDFVLAYHHAWLQMPDRRLVDDSQDGPIGKLKDDLLYFEIKLPMLTRLAWWWTDPNRQAVPPPGVWPDLLKLMMELIKRFGGPEKLLNIFRNNRQNLVQAITRSYLAKFDMERSLIPASDNKLKEIFTLPVSPMRLEHLVGDASGPDAQGTRLYTLVDPNRTLGDYYQKGVAVRVTHANHRTGRLEISAYVPVETFVRFMEKQAWRVEASGPDKLPLGSFRLLVPGNPNAINAGLCSGRFPGVFAPFLLKDIYPDKNQENDLLNKLLDHWLNDPEVEAQMKQAYLGLAPDQARDEAKFNALYARWRKPDAIREYFPLKEDFYVDGGSIDNTPSNSAVDYAREWIEASNKSRHDVELELYVIFLSEEPKVDPDEIMDPAIYQVINRTLKIRGAAQKTSDADNVSTINTFGLRAESLGVALKALVESFQQTLSGMDPALQQQAQERFYQKTKELAVSGYLGETPEGILNRLDDWTANMLKKGIPLQVEAVKIYPMKMPMSTLQFTERLGYKKENAIKMLTSGCYDTLWTLRARLEEQPADALDDRDRQALALAKKWMGFDRWPATQPEKDQLRQDWQCRRTGCVYYSQHCDYGAKKNK